MQEIITGDNLMFPVQLTAGKTFFDMTAAQSVKAMLVSVDHTEKYMDTPVSMLSTFTGADWSMSLVTIKIPGTATKGITYSGEARLEIQVSFTDGASTRDQTWFLPVNIVLGNVE